MAITFEVIDLNCQSSDRSFFVPQVTMSGASVSTFATVLGYSEFGTPSTPPKKYRTITFTGTSERVAFTAEQTPRQCGGAKYVYSGAGQIDLLGNQTSKYSKKFYAQCSKQYWPPEPLQLNDFAITTGGFAPTLVGFCFPTVFSSCPVCDPSDVNWPFIGDQAVNIPIVDLAAFMHNQNDAVVTSTSWSVNDVFYGLTSINTGAAYTAVLFGTDSSNYPVVVGPGAPLTGRAVVTTPGVLDFPPVAIQDSGGAFITAQYVVFTDTNNYSAVLTDEYTDADATTNAKVVNGTGLVAQNLPRTTGFTSVTTTVTFTINCINLIPGTNYNVSVDFLDLNSGAVVSNQYPFTASGPTHTITDTIPTPAAGHSTQVKNPQISFA